MHRRDAPAYAQSREMPREFAIVDGRRSAYVTAGDGSPVIVFLSGAGMDIDSWFKVYPTATTMSTAIAYDRLGVARSDRPTVPQTGDVIIATLRTLLQQAGLTPPYLLVGHSLGGLHAELFARTHPEEVCGIVLVEPSSPEEVTEQEPGRGFIPRLINRTFEVLDRIRGRYGLSEVDVIGDTVRQVHEAPPFPAVPLVVITGGRRMRMVPEAAFRAHRHAQDGRVRLAPDGRQVIAHKSGHFPHLDEPEIVIDAVRDLVRRCGEWHSPDPA